MVYQIFLGIISILLGIYLIRSNIEEPWDKVYSSNNLGDWLFGILSIVGGIYMIIDAIFK